MIRNTFFIIILNFLITFPLALTTYKWYPISTFPQDSPVYIELSQDIIHSSAAAPFRHRIITPLMVHFSQDLPSWPTKSLTVFENKKIQSIFFRFIAINYIWILLTSGLVYYWLRKCLNRSNLVSVIGSIAFMLSYPMMSNGYIPMMDAGAHFFIGLTTILSFKRRWFWVFLVALIGIFQKEIVVIVTGLWILLLFGWNRQWIHLFKGLTSLLPSVIAFYIFTKFAPAASPFHDTILIQLTDGIRSLPSYLSFDMLTQVGLANIGLFIAMIGHLQLKKHTQTVAFPLHWLLIAIPLFLISVYFKIGAGNAGRICGFGLIVYISYQMAVLDAFLNHLRTDER